MAHPKSAAWPAAWKEVRRRIDEGASIAGTARALGVHPSTLHRWLQKEKAPDSAKAGRAPHAKPSRAKPAARERATTARRRKSDAGSVGAAARPARSPALAVRRQLINRLYRAIDTKLKLMERRMHSEINAIEQGAPDDPSGQTAADHERETRAFGALVKTINSVRQMQAELEDLATGTPSTSAADARLAADADRYRRDIAERLAKFVPPQS